MPLKIELLKASANNKKSNILELPISAPDCISPYFFGYSMQETLNLFETKIKFIEKVNGYTRIKLPDERPSITHKFNVT